MTARAIAACMTALAITSRTYAGDPPANATPPSGVTDDMEPATAQAPRAPATETPLSLRYQKTLVLDSSIGAIAFLGEFGKVAPPGPWMHVQLGYELMKSLMLYGESELAFTDTGNTQAPPHTRAFPLFGFGGGARLSVRFTDRFGVYAQGGLGMMKADIATRALGNLGFRNAESLGLYLGSRLGVEWFQIDRHFALGLNTGIRIAQGFAKLAAGTDTPLALDGGASLRYAF